MTNKERLLKLVNDLNEENAAEAVDFVEWLLRDEDSLSEEELDEVKRGEAELARGERVPWKQVKRELGQAYRDL